MTITKGSEWGVPSPLPRGAPIASSDLELRRLVESCRRSGEPVPVVGLTGGTVWRTIGGPSAVGRLRGTEARLFAIDAVEAQLGDVSYWFVGSLIARNRRWTATTLVLNSQFVGDYRFGVRAHPGDGLVDVYEAHLRLRDVLNIAPRARLGAHLPHPGIRETRTDSCTLRFDRPRRVWLDGERAGRASHVLVRVEPDAIRVVV